MKGADGSLRPLRSGCCRGVCATAVRAEDGAQRDCSGTSPDAQTAFLPDGSFDRCSRVRGSHRAVLPMRWHPTRPDGPDCTLAFARSQYGFRIFFPQYVTCDSPSLLNLVNPSEPMNPVTDRGAARSQFARHAPVAPALPGELNGHTTGRAHGRACVAFPGLCAGSASAAFAERPVTHVGEAAREVAANRGIRFVI